MFVDLDWPLNASSLLSASAELLVLHGKLQETQLSLTNRATYSCKCNEWCGWTRKTRRSRPSPFVLPCRQAWDTRSSRTCGSAYMIQPLAIWLTCVCRPILCVVASNCVSRRLRLLVPRTRTATGRRSFAVNGPRTWNSLPAELRTPDMTSSSFKRHLKAHLFQQ